MHNHIEDLEAKNKRLQQWVDDLHAGMFINCVYCGHRYGPDSETPHAMADILKEHVEKCPEHPMSHLKLENAKLREALEEIAHSAKAMNSDILAIEHLWGIAKKALEENDGR